MPSLGLQNLLPSWSKVAFSRFRNRDPTAPDLEKQPLSRHTPTIDPFPPGYPRFAALLSSTDSFLVFRRFKRLRARLLLLQQARVSALEERLDGIDNDEQWLPWLSTGLHDGNTERHKVLKEIREQLVEYDKLAEAANKMLRYDDAQPRDLQSLLNWLDGNGRIAQDDRSYLHQEHDLFSVTPMVDNAMVRFESWVEDRLIQSSWYHDTHENDISHDQEIHTYSSVMIRRLAMGLLISLVTFMLLLPIVVCNVVTTTAIRIFIVMMSTVFYLLVLSGLTRAKTTELVVAATTYATVLIVFVSGTGDSTSK